MAILHCRLACIDSEEKLLCSLFASLDNVCFFPGYFYDFSLYCSSCAVLIMMYLGVVSFVWDSYVSFLWGSSNFLDLWVYSYSQIWYIFSNYFFKYVFVTTPLPLVL